MQKINYPLIVSDFDGTLVRDDGNISKENKEAIDRFCKDGGKFAISTGRLPYAIVPRARELGLHGAAACCQGSIIVDVQTKEVLFHDSLPKDTAVRVCKRLEELQLHIHAYGLWEYYCNKDDEALKAYEALTRTTAHRVTDRPLHEFLRDTDATVYKFTVLVEPKDSLALYETLAKENFEGCCPTRSGTFTVEMINANNSKGTALRFLADYYGVPLERTIGVGDQWNDIPMLQTAGLGVAVQNADDKLKAEAKVILSRTNEENAVCELIETYGYKE